MKATRENMDKAEGLVPFRKIFSTCTQCGGRYSATSGDYFMMKKDTVLTCNECGGDMILAYQLCQTIEVVE